MPQITITIPEVPTEEPSSTFTQDINETTVVGRTFYGTSLGSLSNDGTGAWTHRLEVSNIVGGTLQYVELKVAGVPTQNNPGESFVEVEIAEGSAVEGYIMFDIVPGAPGEPASQLTADYTSAWV